MPRIMPDVVLTPEEDDWVDCGCGQGRDCCGDGGCDSCHTSDDDDDGYYRDDDDDDYGDGGLMSYSYTPSPLIFYDSDGPHTYDDIDPAPQGVPFYGMEIEVTCSDRHTIAWAKTAFNKTHGGGDNLCYFKSDGSVAGFELVTHPMTYPYALASFPWDLLAELKSQGCTIRPSDNGIHVHVARTGFDSDAHALRWFKILYRNQADVLRIARRDQTQWARFTPTHRKAQFTHLKMQKGELAQGNIRSRLYQAEIDYSTALDAHTRLPEYSFRQYRSRFDFTPEEDRLDRQFRDEEQRMTREYSNLISDLRRHQLDDMTRRERYAAINTIPENTFEVRLFASTLDPVTAQSTIGLVSATVEYTRQITSHAIIHDGALTWPKFEEWLNGQPLYAAVKYANENCTGGRARSSI